jgi:hypothetical protein
MLFRAGVPAGTFGESFNARQGFADSTECSCRNTCGSASEALTRLAAFVGRALAAAELSYEEVFLQEHLSSSNVRLQSKIWPYDALFHFDACNAKLRLETGTMCRHDPTCL